MKVNGPLETENKGSKWESILVALAWGPGTFAGPERGAWNRDPMWSFMNSLS